ncbi:olfactory receptor 7G1-like [Dipodomys merriami]|uniref:olfactory receptor 7G1-like n=1 Tax=Dipodomys merriami TaxID=94247 RepID=UPI0038557D23
MEPTNETASIEFFLLGLTDDPELQPFIFSLFLSTYLFTILGNLLIILAVSADPHLHTPMYFFLSNLSFTDICISTTTIPKVLVNIKAEDQSITYTGCLVQIGSVVTFGGLENCLLVVMAYDRYVAICHPLRYTVIMHPGLCVLLVFYSLFISAVHALLHSLMASHLSFCQDVEIPHFFCELTQVIRLACSDTLINNLLMYIVSSLFFGVPLVGIIFSYAQILSSVLRLPSAGGKSKAFSTCGSHLLVVSLFYGTGFSVYMSSAVTESSFKNIVASMMYIVIPQMLNPFIYSMRNKEMKGALRHLIMVLSSLCGGEGERLGNPNLSTYNFLSR